MAANWSLCQSTFFISGKTDLTTFRSLGIISGRPAIVLTLPKTRDFLPHHEDRLRRILTAYP
ncbi:MAG: hypothetical protein PX640_00960 [Microcystis sp. M49629_WE12]|nr:hypothetical protein [Microcystis sp. M49629_WE12]